MHLFHTAFEILLLPLPSVLHSLSFNNNTGTFLCKFFRNGFTDTTGTAGNQRNTARQSFWLWHTLQFCFFQQPVFNIECFLSGQRSILRNSFGAFHYIDGIDIKFCSYPGRLFIFCKGEHTYTRI